MGTKIKLFNLLLIIFASIELCAEPSWMMWTRKYFEYALPFLIGKSVEKQEMYDNFADELLSKKKMTVQQHLGQVFKKMNQDALKETQKSTGLSDQQIAGVMQLKKGIKQTEKGEKIQITYDQRVPEATLKVVETLCKEYSITAPVVVELTNDPKKHAFVSRKDNSFVLSINKNLVREDTEKQLFILAHEIGGHIKHYDPLEAGLILLLANNGIQGRKFVYGGPELAKLDAFHEFRANHKPLAKNIQTLLLAKSNWHTARSEKGDDIHVPGDLNYQIITRTQRLLEAQSRWIWGPKGYEKYGNQYYDNAFVKHMEKNSNKRFWQFWK